MNILLLAVFIGCVQSNYLYQWIGRRRWYDAYERSWFQGVALIAVWIAMRVMQ